MRNSSTIDGLELSTNFPIMSPFLERGSTQTSLGFELACCGYLLWNHTLINKKTRFLETILWIDYFEKTLRENLYRSISKKSNCLEY